MVTNATSRLEFTPLENIRDDQWAKNSWSTYIGDCFRALQDARLMGTYTYFNNSPLTNYNLLKSLITSICSLFSSRVTPAGFVGSDTIVKFLRDSGFERIERDEYILVRESNPKLCVLTCCLNEMGKVKANLLARQDCLKNYDRVLVPIVLKGHVTTLFIDRNLKKIVHYDPQGFNPDLRKSKIRDLKTELLAIKTLFGEDYEVDVLTEKGIVPHDQRSRVDCGPISMHFMQFLFKEESNVLNFDPTFQEDSPNRVSMRRDLVNDPKSREPSSLLDEIDALELFEDFRDDLQA